MILDLDFSQVPDKVLPVEAGDYFFTITKCDFAEAKGEQSDRYALTLKVNEGPMKDRVIFDNYPIEYLRDFSHPATVRFKHLVRSAGLDTTKRNVNTEELVGKSVKATVVHKMGKDKAGNMETYANIKDYIV